jgi:hypothetical protein
VVRRGPILPLADIDKVYVGAQDDLVDLVPTTPHILATGSEHYIQLSQPDLVVNAVRLVIDRSTIGAARARHQCDARASDTSTGLARYTAGNSRLRLSTFGRSL